MIFEAPAAAPTAASASRRAAQGRAELVQEAEAHRALAELFPHLQLQALRAIQELFPVAQQQSGAATRVH